MVSAQIRPLLLNLQNGLLHQSFLHQKFYLMQQALQHHLRYRHPYLHRKEFSYRYECELVLGNDTFYPDFTIFHPLTSNIIYWEHFGMMDVPSYCDQTFSKLKHFSHYGILPGIQLITTYETKQNPINSEQIEQIVSNYFEM